MKHVDALSRNPTPVCMVTSECESSVLLRLRKAQREDPDLKPIIESVNSEKMSNSEYIVRNGLLCRVLDDDPRIVVPRAMQTQIVRQMHENGHFRLARRTPLSKRTTGSRT